MERQRRASGFTFLAVTSYTLFDQEGTTFSKPELEYTNIIKKHDSIYSSPFCLFISALSVSLPFPFYSCWSPSVANHSWQSLPHRPPQSTDVKETSAKFLTGHLVLQTWSIRYSIYSVAHIPLIEICKLGVCASWASLIELNRDYFQSNMKFL